MKKNDVFTFKAPNGAEVIGIVISVIRDDRDDKWYLCYAQNRLFDYRVLSGIEHPLINIWVEYCIIPECDNILEEYFHQLDLADDYASKEV